ncbi:MAG: biopolymer transporter ExbD [Thermodesulfobacteriota bacterium]
MRLRRRLTADDEAVPMASMADIAFLLIIFFMVTMVFSVDRGLLIELPQTAVQESVNLREIVLSITSEGRIQADGRFVSLAEVGPYVRAARAANPRGPVVVRSDRRVAYGTIADVMDELLQAGVRDVALPTAAEGDSR